MGVNTTGESLFRPRSGNLVTDKENPKKMGTEWHELKVPNFHCACRFHLTQILKGRGGTPPMNRGSENEERMEVEMADFMSDFKMQAWPSLHIHVPT